MKEWISGRRKPFVEQIVVVTVLWCVVNVYAMWHVPHSHTTRPTSTWQEGTPATCCSLYPWQELIHGCVQGDSFGHFSHNNLQPISMPMTGTILENLTATVTSERLCNITSWQELWLNTPDHPDSNRNTWKATQYHMLTEFMNKHPRPPRQQQKRLKGNAISRVDRILWINTPDHRDSNRNAWKSTQYHELTGFMNKHPWPPWQQQKCLKGNTISQVERIYE